MTKKIQEGAQERWKELTERGEDGPPRWADDPARCFWHGWVEGRAKTAHSDGLGVDDLMKIVLEWISWISNSPTWAGDPDALRDRVNEELRSRLQAAIDNNH